MKGIGERRRRNWDKWEREEWQRMEEGEGKIEISGTRHKKRKSRS